MPEGARRTTAMEMMGTEARSADAGVRRAGSLDANCSPAYARPSMRGVKLRGTIFGVSGLGVGTLMAACGGPTAPPPPSQPAATETRCSTKDAPGNVGPAGLPADDPAGCAEGFEPDPEGGCRPILGDACLPGLMAVPGESACYEVAPCGDGDYGDIPVDATTVFVNAAYQGTNSDGSVEHPFHEINQAFVVAPAGGLIAVAAGSYPAVQILGKGVRLWGRCPRLVHINGPHPVAEIEIGNLSNGTEVHGIAMVGAAVGAFVTEALDVWFDQVWVHDTGKIGILVRNSSGAATARISRSLVERAHIAGIGARGVRVDVDQTVVRGGLVFHDSSGDVGGDGIRVEASDTDTGPPLVNVSRSVLERNDHGGASVYGAALVVTGSVMRDNRATNDGRSGFGVFADYAPTLKKRPSVTIQKSLLAGNRDTAVMAFAADLTVESTVVRDTLQNDDGTAGIGITTGTSFDGKERASVTVRGTRIEGSHAAGILLRGADAELDSCLIRNTQLDGTGEYGRGIGVEPDPDTKVLSSVHLTQVLIQDSQEVGIYLSGATAHIEASAVCDTAGHGDGPFGRGIAVQSDPATNSHSTATITGTVIDGSGQIGVFVSGSTVALEGVVVRDTEGMGIIVQRPLGVSTSFVPTATIHDTTVRRSLIAGVAVAGATAHIEDCTIDDTRPKDGKFGDGISVASQDGAAQAEIRSCSIENSARAGVSNFGAQVVITDTTLECSAFDLEGEKFGGVPFSFDGSMANTCGCGAATWDCKSQSAGLSPPAAMPEQ